MADTEYGCWLAELTVFWRDVSPCPLITFCLHCTDKMLLEEGLWRSGFFFLHVSSCFYKRNLILPHAVWRQIMFVCVCLLAAPIPFFPSITGLYRFPAGLDYIQNMRLLSDLDTLCLLLSGWGDPPPITSTSTPFSFSSSSLSSFLVLLQSLLLPISPSFPWPETGDMWWQRCQHRSQWSSLPLFPLARQSMHSSPFTVSINLLSVLSGSTFLPIKSFYCPALQGSGYTGL